MRKQYNLRKSEQGLKAWDVHRLIELSKKLIVKSVLLCDIKEVNEPYWFEHNTNLPTCADVLSHMKLVQEAELTYPIILCADGRLMDGMHRIIKALLEGHEEIKAVQFEITPEPDFINISVDDLPY
ncbi:hypothetical protein LPB248_03065 [Flavobacterium sp. LPB0248]|nr:hypothetical protein LPB248_03065 [Flavobacterium sp. LPB0248]